MKLQIVLLIVVFVAAYAAPQNKYTSKYDNIDLDSIFKSDRLLSNYINCLMDRGRCTPDAMELKIVLPDALQNDCAKCSEEQQKSGKKVVNFMIKNKPNEWKELEQKYDPEGIYKKKYDEEIKQ
ncbi:unnamed protein product [Brassicogethes aeneus]|uniref:Uncharacterized protein n=1 Tax=Brassicogethes aeneus TaxID=1431903 RepID=A0A9P0AXX5_BRAAE|nr:unnamed protein product [Brassicogethes aeneus]